MIGTACLFLLASHISVDANRAQQGRQYPQLPDRSLLSKPELDIDYGKIPLYFIANEGQVDEKALFYADASR
jgi:hypothetical protein